MQSARGPIADRTLAEVLERALVAAKRAGASYADARLVRRRNENVATREDHVVTVASGESYGIGVRVVAKGAWGFSAASKVDGAVAEAVAQRAVEIALTNAKLQKRPVELAPVPTYRASWATPTKVDPFTVPLADRAAMLLSIWPEAKAVAGVKFCSAWCEALGEWKLFASSEGSLIEQSIVRLGAGYQVTASDAATGDFVTRESELPPRQTGWEYIASAPLRADARRIAEDAVAKLRAPSVVPGKRNLVLTPSNLWLTIHESVGHPTELDRALGYEANFAGTSFATPDKLGKLKYAAPHVTLYADKTVPGGLATCGYDDDGVKTQKWDLVKDGLFVGYQTTRDQAGWIGEKASRGTSYAEDYASIPFQRMPNVSLAPGAKAGVGLAEVIAATDDGILVSGNGSWSIDHQRYNFQFGGQTFHEIKGGKVTGPLRDVAYQSNSVEFWNSCDMLGDEKSWELHGSLHDGKGEPSQTNAVSHGCPPARFSQVNILNTRGGSKS